MERITTDKCDPEIELSRNDKIFFIYKFRDFSPFGWGVFRKKYRYVMVSKDDVEVFEFHIIINHGRVISETEFEDMMRVHKQSHNDNSNPGDNLIGKMLLKEMEEQEDTLLLLAEK